LGRAVAVVVAEGAGAGGAGLCAGIRNRELRGRQGRHFQREGWLWISAEIAKGGRERWVPVLPELVPIAREIRATVAPDE
jgi:integrase